MVSLKYNFSTNYARNSLAVVHNGAIINAYLDRETNNLNTVLEHSVTLLFKVRVNSQYSSDLLDKAMNLSKMKVELPQQFQTLDLSFKAHLNIWIHILLLVLPSSHCCLNNNNKSYQYFNEPFINSFNYNNQESWSESWIFWLNYFHPMKTDQRRYVLLSNGDPKIRPFFITTTWSYWSLKNGN